MSLHAYELKVTDAMDRARCVARLRCHGEPLLVLDTCQRLEIFAPAATDLGEFPVSQQWRDAVAFERLARIAAGLESRVIGELEVLGQVRDAYKDFRGRSPPQAASLDRFFQQALALARRARRDSGIDRKMTSLSGLAAREILRQVEPGTPLAVVGSGSLASAVARYFHKRGKASIRISSRCPENAVRLAMRVNGFGAGLDQLAHLLAGVGGIVTATTAPHSVLYAHHLAQAQQPLWIVDLGTPPDCHPDVARLTGPRYTGLEVIEAKAHTNAGERRTRAEVAARIIRDGAMAWAQQH